MSKKIAKALGADRVLNPVQLAVENLALRRAFNLAKKKLAVTQQDLQEYKRLFESQHSRSRDADILWRERHGKPDTSPDLGALLDWLIERGNRWQVVITAAKDLDYNFNGVRWEAGNATDEARWISLRKAIERYDEFYEGTPL